MKSCFYLILINFIIFLGFPLTYSKNVKCETPSITTASGNLINRNEVFCPGDLIFEDNFNNLDLETWQHELTLAGGGNWEFQWYTNNRSNSFIKHGHLHIRPSLSSDIFGEEMLTNGSLFIYGGAPADECTNPSFWGCQRQATPDNIINPVRSARVRTVHSFNFKYGKLQVRAKLPSGDWLWPSIWLLPKRNAYGSWPASGEIDIIEARGNVNLMKDGVNIGAEQISSDMHFAPFPAVNGFIETHFQRNTKPGNGFDKDFHVYEMEWTPEMIKFKVDEEEFGKVEVGSGFWEIGGFSKYGEIENPWKTGTNAAPFDQEFFIIISLAVGGITFFPDDAVNPTPKPWKNTSPIAAKEFWDARNDWLPTWNLDDKNSTSSSLLVDYIRVYAL